MGTTLAARCRRCAAAASLVQFLQFAACAMLFALPAAAADNVFPGKDWQVDPPEKHGLSAEKLKAAAEAVKLVTQRYGFVVVKDGAIVHEVYFNGDKDTKHMAASVTKSFGSALVGIAHTKGLLNVKDPVTDWLPHHHQDIVKGATIENLISHTAGHEPAGSRMQYTSGPILNTVPSILWEATGMPPYAFYEKELAGPLGLTLNWPHTEKGWLQFGTERLPVMTVSHRDMARLGLLWLNKGNWNGKQIISEDYIKASTTPPYPQANANYGYLWWLNTGSTPLKSAPANVYNAIGGSAQLIYVIPDHNMVVTTMGSTRGNDAASKIWTAIESFLPAK